MLFELGPFLKFQSVLGIETTVGIQVPETSSYWTFTCLLSGWPSGYRTQMVTVLGKIRKINNVCNKMGKMLTKKKMSKRSINNELETIQSGQLSQ